jgi:hypothetical protein
LQAVLQGGDIPVTRYAKAVVVKDAGPVFQKNYGGWGRLCDIKPCCRQLLSFCTWLAVVGFLTNVLSYPHPTYLTNLCAVTGCASLWILSPASCSKPAIAQPCPTYCHPTTPYGHSLQVGMS